MMQTMQKALKLLVEHGLGKDSQGSGQGNTRGGSGGVKNVRSGEVRDKSYL